MPPYACGNFHAWAFTRFQKPEQLGRARTACSSIVTWRAQRAGPRSATSAAASCGWIYWQRRLESCSSSSSLQRGWSARMATRWSSHRPGVLCGIGLHISLRRTILSKSLRAPARVALTIHTFRMVDRTTGLGRHFCSGRGENLVTIARFGKPLFADMHHHVHAVAGALRKANVACPHPDITDASVLTFGRRFFAKNVAIDLKCIENHAGTLHS